MNVHDCFGVAAPRVRSLKMAMECVNPSLVIGLELETEKCEGDGGWYEDSVKKLNFQVKTDGSLRGNAFEFISLPMRSDQALGALDAFFTATQFNEDNYSDRCSVHVHVNCTDMEFEQISSLALLYTTMEEILFEFVGHNRDSNIYCIPWNQCRAHLNLVQNFLSDGGSVLRRWSKYTALNLLPLSTLGTVEFRQMHGTADMKKLTTWINIIGAMFAYAKTVELKDLIEQIKDLNTTSQYEVFFNRVLAMQLPYTDKYKEKLEEGIILAKYSLMNMGTMKNKDETTAPMPDPFEAIRQAAPLVQPRGLGNAARNNAQIHMVHDMIARQARAQVMLQPGLAMDQGEFVVNDWGNVNMGGPA